MEQPARKRTKLLTIFLWALLLTSFVAIVNGVQVYAELRHAVWQEGAANLAGRLLGVPLLVVAAVAIVRVFRKRKPQDSD